MGSRKVGAAGFEPATFRPQTERATRLRHAPTEDKYGGARGGGHRTSVGRSGAGLKLRGPRAEGGHGVHACTLPPQRPGRALGPGLRGAGDGSSRRRLRRARPGRERALRRRRCAARPGGWRRPARRHAVPDERRARGARARAPAGRAAAWAAWPPATRARWCAGASSTTPRPAARRCSRGSGRRAICATSRSWSVGENLAWGTGVLATPRATVRAWMHSPDHRANLLDRRFADVGIGVAAGAPIALERGRARRHLRDRLRAPAARLTARRRAARVAAAMADVQPLRALHYDLAKVGSLRRRRRAALRRHRPRAARPPGRALALQRRARRPARGRGRTRTPRPPTIFERWQRRGRRRARRRARAVDAHPGLHRPRRARAHPPRRLRARARRGLRPRAHPPARAHAPGPEGGPAAAHARDEGQPLPHLQPLRRPDRRDRRAC